MHSVYLPPEVGGLESHVYFLCRALVARGHEVDAVTSHSLPDLPEHEVMEGVRIWRTWMPARNTAGWASHALCSMPRFSSLAERADVLHAQDIAAILPCMAAQRVRDAPIVATYHTSHFLKRANSLIWRPVFKQFLQSADHNLAASREIASVAESIAPGIAVEPLTNGVDTNFFRKVKPLLANPDRGTKRLVAPRRLVEKNGVEYLIRAMPEILEEVKAELVVIGDGPQRSSLERLSEELGVNKKVAFLGSRPHADMPGLLSSADLAVFPSLMEATSVAALECLACEVPVAASRVGGLPEIIRGDVGALFEPGDPASLSRGVVGLLQKSGLEKFGTTGRQRVIDFWSNDRLADRHAEIYEAVIQNRQAA